MLHVLGVLQFDYHKKLQNQQSSQQMQDTKSFHLDNNPKKHQFEEHYEIHPSSQKIPPKEESFVQEFDEINCGSIMRKFEQIIKSRGDIFSSKQSIPQSENLIPEKKMFYTQMQIKDQGSNLLIEDKRPLEQYQAVSSQDIVRKRLKRYFSYKQKIHYRQIYKKDNSKEKKKEDTITQQRQEINNVIQEAKNEPGSDKQTDSILSLTGQEVGYIQSLEYNMTKFSSQMNFKTQLTSKHKINQ